jgi:uncharacterized membrane protein YdjX (TVP38/TMEM64 family)
MRVIKLLSLLIIGCLISYYIYLVHTGEAQNILNHIRNLGVLGGIIGTAVQTLTNIIPVPGEFISIALMEIYGPVWGGLFAWLGGIAGAVGALYLTKWIAKPFFANMAQPYLEKMDEFIQKRGQVGLLLIRFVPFVPYHLVNYAAGILNVKLWGFIWTTAIGILPFTLAMSALYAGVRQGSWIWGIAGLGIVVMLVSISWCVSSSSRNRRAEQLNRPSNHPELIQRSSK